MNKQIRFIPALALGMAMLSIPTLTATAEVIVNVLGATPYRQRCRRHRVNRGHLQPGFW